MEFDFGFVPSDTLLLYMFMGSVVICDCNDSRFSLMTCCLIETESESLSVIEMHVETCRIW